MRQNSFLGGGGWDEAVSDVEELCDVVTIVNKRGLHARAAAKLVRVLTPFACEMELAYGDMRVSARSIMGLMMLAASQGARVRVCAKGSDASAALQAAVDLIAGGFDENE